jgi:hypothetical protein
MLKWARRLPRLAMRRPSRWNSIHIRLRCLLLMPKFDFPLKSFKTLLFCGESLMEHSDEMLRKLIFHLLNGIHGRPNSEGIISICLKNCCLFQKRHLGLSFRVTSIWPSSEKFRPLYTRPKTFSRLVKISTSTEYPCKQLLCGCTQHKSHYSLQSPQVHATPMHRGALIGRRILASHTF